MSDINIHKPEDGQVAVVAMAYNQQDSRIVLDFSMADTFVCRMENDLVFTFEDGSSVVLANFYNAYTEDALPEFEVLKASIRGEDFLAECGAAMLRRNDDEESHSIAQARHHGFFMPSLSLNSADFLDNLNIHYDTGSLERGRLRLQSDTELDARLAMLPGFSSSWNRAQGEN